MTTTERRLLALAGLILLQADAGITRRMAGCVCDYVECRKEEHLPSSDDMRVYSGRVYLA